MSFCLFSLSYRIFFLHLWYFEDSGTHSLSRAVRQAVSWQPGCSCAEDSRQSAVWWSCWSNCSNYFVCFLSFLTLWIIKGLYGYWNPANVTNDTLKSYGNEWIIVVVGISIKSIFRSTGLLVFYRLTGTIRYIWI